jgi:hypothetical protein
VEGSICILDIGRHIDNGFSDLCGAMGVGDDLIELQLSGFEFFELLIRV